MTKPTKIDAHPVPYENALESGEFRGVVECVVDADTLGPVEEVECREGFEHKEWHIERRRAPG